MLSTITKLLSQFKLSRLVLILSLVVIVAMLVSTLASTNRVRAGVVKVEHQALKTHVTTLAKLVASQPVKYEALKKIVYPARWNDDNSGYAFLADGATARYILYPPKPAKEGNKMAAINLNEGGTLEQAIIRTSQRGIAEMVHYMHKKPNTTEAILKAAYLYPIKQGGAVLISGTYLDKSDSILLEIYKRTFISLTIIATFVLLFVSILARHINLRTNYLSRAMSNLANGNLCEPISLSGRDEIAVLAKDLNTCQASLSNILKQQTDNGTNIATASLQIDTNLNHTNELIRSELSNLDQLASAMEEMVCSVAEVAENATSASRNAQSADQRTHQGEKQIQQCIAEIEHLCQNLSNCIQSVNEVKDGVISINSIVDTIHSISEQTNLLALNAAIEAARAGENGRGFAVVADEVRQLASRTQVATKEITETIGQLKTQALSAVSLVDQSATTAEDGMSAAKSAGNEFVSITDNVSSLNDRNLQIATAAEQQRNVALTMSQNINHLNSELAETSHDLEGLASASNNLKDQTDLLDKQLSQFSFEQGKAALQQDKPVDEQEMATEAVVAS